jgi:hypothetical protein
MGVPRYDLDKGLVTILTEFCENNMEERDTDETRDNLQEDSTTQLNSDYRLVQTQPKKESVSYNL